MKWSQATEAISLDAFKNQNYVIYNEDKVERIYFLFHGFGSSYQDLMPLAQQLKHEGYTVVLIALSGHAGVYQPDKMNMSVWLHECKLVVERLSVNYRSIHFIGFSMGAMIALILASQLKGHVQIDSITAISLYAGLKENSPQLFFLGLLEKLGIKEVPRWVQVSSKHTIRQLSYWDNLPVGIVKQLNQDIKDCIHHMKSIDTKVLLLHSYEDAVASYDLVKVLCNEKLKNGYLVTFRHLKHFMQFDIPIQQQWNIMETFFNPPQSQSGDYCEKETDEWYKKIYEEVHKEIHQCIAHNFNLIVGFFSIFGALLYATLPIVTTQHPTSPYYIVAYSLIINIYILIGSTYVFYMNRAIAYSKNVVEPNMPLLGINSYKQTAHAAGKESTTTTYLFSLVSTVLPLVTSVAAILYNVVRYDERFLVFEYRNILLQALLICSIGLFGVAVYSLFRLMNHANREIYGLYVNNKTCRHLEQQIFIANRMIRYGCANVELD